MEEEAAPPTGGIHCGACGGDLEGAILMTCLHVLCPNCLPAPASVKGNNHEISYLCPVCGPATSQDNMTSDMTSRIASQPCTSMEEVKQRAGNQGSDPHHHLDLGEEVDENEDDDENGDSNETGEDFNFVFTSSMTFVCSHHSQREAGQFCTSCHLLACSKCIISVHKKCSPQHILNLSEAVTSQRPSLNSLHTKIAQKVVRAKENLRDEEKRLKSLEEQRKVLIDQITAQKEALVRALVEKEQKLIGEVNAALDKERGRVEGRAEQNQRSARAAEGQLSVLEAVMSVKGEPEILSLLPALHTRLDAENSNSAGAGGATSLHLTFDINKKLSDEINKSDLGEITRADKSDKGDKSKHDDSDLHFTLLTSFHARTREDSVDPLLTDLVLLPTGDVIMTDRDNKCVKKFNFTGHLLTRVQIPETPSRLALVSHGKAVISVMNRKVLFFLSLLGTVRILSSVKVKKLYCFLAAAGQGQGQDECQLLAATNLCDVIDLISESGVLLRRLFTHKGERVNISRPLYLHAPSTPGDREIAVLVVDSGRRMLFGLTADGQTVFTYKPKDENSLECPLGVATIPPTGLILLADRDKQRVVLLGRRGKFIREVFGEKEGLHKPCALYGGLPGTVALTQVDGWVKIYKID